MSESSITKDCYTRRAVKHTHIYIKRYIAMYILQRSNNMLQRTSQCGTALYSRTGSSCNPHIPSSRASIPPEWSKATKLCPGTPSTRPNRVSDKHFCHIYGQMRAQTDQKSLWADIPTAIYCFSRQQTCCPLVPGVVVSWQSSGKPFPSLAPQMPLLWF